MCDPAFIPRVAALLAQFHAVAVPGLPRAPGLFPTIRRWLAMAHALEFPPGDKAAAYAALDFGAIEGARARARVGARCSGRASGMCTRRVSPARARARAAGARPPRPAC